MQDYKWLLIEEAEKGDASSVLELASHYLEAKSDVVPTDKTKHLVRNLAALAEDDKQCDSDRKSAMVSLGAMYYVGKGVEQSYTEAVRWYKKAADMTDPWGLCNLGYCYYYGRDISVDYEKAYACFAKSAIMGNTNAMYKLGDMYYEGKHLKEDKNAAYYWYRAAYGSDENYDYRTVPDVERRLGKCYLYGHGVKQDVLHALKLLQSAEIGFLKKMDNGDKFAVLSFPLLNTEIELARKMLYSAKGITP